MDNVQEHNICINVPSSQTCRSYLQISCFKHGNDFMISVRIWKLFVGNGEVFRKCSGNSVNRATLTQTDLQYQSSGSGLENRD
jgi:hypothetical protein